jgi:hypothetical protein
MNCVICTRQAVQEFTASRPMNIEVILADHQNKADVGASIARQWCDEGGVDALVDVRAGRPAVLLNEIIPDGYLWRSSPTNTNPVTGSDQIRGMWGQNLANATLLPLYSRWPHPTVTSTVIRTPNTLQVLTDMCCAKAALLKI